MLGVPLIELESVGYRQQSTDILADVNWRLDRGEHWAILGPNGSGKTTLLNIVCGYLWPTAGVVRRLGEELLDLVELRRSIGWVAANLVSQIPGSELAVETVATGKYAQLGLKPLAVGDDVAADLAAARALLESMGCGDLAGKTFGILSQGERQQVLVARARMVDPLLIVLDEPCAGMDPGVRERFLAWLDGLAASPGGCSLVLVTHHVEEIMPHFDRVLIMEGGRVAATGAASELISASLMEQIYGVAVERIERSSGRWWPIWGSPRDS